MDEILVGHERDPYNGRIPLEKKTKTTSFPFFLAQLDACSLFSMGYKLN